MSKTLKVVVLRGRNDTNALALGAALDQACLEILVANPRQRHSVLEFWEDVTSGYFRFDVTVAPWVDVSFSSTDADSAGTISRSTQHAKIAAATKLKPGFADLSSYDGIIVLTAPGAAFANPQAQQPGQPATLSFDGGRVGNVAVLPVSTSTLAFMCHEFGHVLGLFDSEGVTTAGGSGTSYNDPFDIMSNATYAGAWPVFSATPIPGWPNAAAMNVLGPAPSKAEIHHFFPDALPAQSVKKVVITNGATPSLFLAAAYGSQGPTKLIAIDPPNPAVNSIGRCYIEYRRARGWDAGLETTGRVLDRQGIVFHVVDVRTPDLGAGDTTGVRTFYRGQIPIPLVNDTDLRVRGTPYTVRVTEVAADNSFVWVKVGLSSPTGFEIDLSGRDITMRNARPTIPRLTPCGDEIEWGHWETISEYQFLPITWGLGGEGSSTTTPSVPPTINWTVGGVPVPSNSPSGMLYKCASPQGWFNVAYTQDLDVGTLTLRSEKQGQTYQMEVRATAQHPSNPGVVLNQTATFESLGSYVGYTPSDQAALARCLVNVLNKIHINPEDLVFPDGDGPRPNWRVLAQRLADRVRVIGPRYGEEVRALEKIVELSQELRPPG